MSAYSIKLPPEFRPALQAMASRHQQRIQERDGIIAEVSPTSLAVSAVRSMILSDDPAAFERKREPEAEPVEPVEPEVSCADDLPPR
jgi:hypothetical protein